MIAPVRKSRGERIEQKRVQLEQAMLEGYDDLLKQWVDPREQFIDAYTGEHWMELGLGTSEDRQVPFTTETEHRIIRQRARLDAAKNPYAINLIGSMQNFVVGPGHVYKVVSDDDADEDPAAKKLVKQVQDWLDNLLKVNKWGKRQREIVRRNERDGECFIRKFFQSDGMTLFRFVEPLNVSRGNDQRNHATFGIVTEPDDVEVVVGFIIDGEEVDADFVQHRKRNVDMNVKRGLSSLYSIRDSLSRAQKLLRNMSQTVANQSAIAMIRKHQASKGAVQSFAAGLATATITDPITSKVERIHKMPGGTILDVRANTEYEFPSQGLNPSGPTGVLGAELRAVASSKSMPEYMIGSDASNANYSSTMVAESPAVAMFLNEQDMMIEEDLELIEEAMDHAVVMGELPQEAMLKIKIEVEPPKIITRDEEKQTKSTGELVERRVMSPQTAAAKHGLEYEQEQRNWARHDDMTLGDDTPLNQGDASGELDETGAALGGESKLLGLAGGISGALEIFTKLNAREVTRETAKEMLKMFFKLDDQEADDLINESDELEPAEAGPEV